MVKTVGEKNYLQKKLRWICTFWERIAFSIDRKSNGSVWHQNHFWRLKTFHYKKYPSANGTIRTNKPNDEEVQGIVARVLSNQDEVKKTFSSSCWELLELFKEKANPTKEVTYDEFIAASYGE
jgi:hypothetical protein